MHYATHQLAKYSSRHLCAGLLSQCDDSHSQRGHGLHGAQVLGVLALAPFLALRLLALA